ncbi:MAG: glycoside hydrolase family 78 protein [Muribaculaceae bacterium]|nr:glycoside hydrolase family 78 protein [Roseburia sp.]MCM1430762.1 glycoside hydrolase family 78 protein [Muribaculaceae bacterium]MCM1492741.1 glycoside hydrolase family 78 protein [Muribaculaceae bacterium]
MKITHLRTNHMKNPLGNDLPYLVLSWKLTDAGADLPSGVQITVSETEDMRIPVYDSGMMSGFMQCQLRIPLALRARTRYFWKVTAQTASGTVESGTAWFETGKRGEAWSADFISVAEDKERMPVFYRDFFVSQPVKKARLYIFGAGLYEVSINGQKAGDEYLLPGYHSYDFLMEYQTFDVAELLKDGENRIEILLGEGWYKGRFGFDDVYLDLYGDRKKCIAELIWEDETGKEQQLVTDGLWSAHTGNVGENGIYDGEWQNDTWEEQPLTVEILPDGTELLTERSNPPIRKVEEFCPVSKKVERDGILLDFGEAITGWAEFTGQLKKGQQLRLLYGEVLQDGKFFRDNLRTAKAEFVYTSDGAHKTVRPHFTFYGFRYVRVEGLEEGQELSFRAYRIMSDIEETGNIETSNEKVNRLFANTLRSQKCNFLDIPTDCPQRDERMGWTGDANIFAPTACFHMDSSAFFRHYTRSLYPEQKLLGGAVPFFSPRPKVPLKENTNPFYRDGGACAWADVATMLPWNLYQYYGDVSMLREQYPMMKLWVDYVRGRAEQNDTPWLWQNDMQLGDWLALDNGNIHNPIGKTDSGFLASAWFYLSTVTLAKAAAVLALEAEEETYRTLAANIKKAFISFYFTEEGKLNIEPTQTACAFLLYIGLYPEHARETLAAELKRLIEENNGHLNTGFVGTPVLCPALSENGLNTLAYDLLLNEEYPGWLFEVNLGATTVWERWNSLDENGVISDMGMNSLNHYAYGSIADWMYRYMCGFLPEMAGEVPMTIRPMPDRRFSFVRGSFESVFGTFRSAWTYSEEKGFSYEIEIPYPANAKVIFPNGKSRLLGGGTYVFDQNGECI